MVICLPLKTWDCRTLAIRDVYGLTVTSVSSISMSVASLRYQDLDCGVSEPWACMANITSPQNYNIQREWDWATKASKSLMWNIQWSEQICWLFKYSINKMKAFPFSEKADKSRTELKRFAIAWQLTLAWMFTTVWSHNCSDREASPTNWIFVTYCLGQTKPSITGN